MKSVILECVLVLIAFAVLEETALARNYLNCLTKKVTIVDAPKGATSSSIEENFGFWIDEATKIVTLADGKKLDVRRIADVTQTKDAYHPSALVDHRQPAHLQVLHVPHCFDEVIVISAAMDAWSHHIARRRAVDIETVLHQSFADDVTVGHHADQPVVLFNGNGAYVTLTHQFCEFGHR